MPLASSCRSSSPGSWATSGRERLFNPDPPRLPREPPGKAADIGARSAGHAARAAAAVADTRTRAADAAAYAALAVNSADGAAHGISPAVRTDVRDKIEAWLHEHVRSMESVW
jgi:hypothetical protein